MQNGHWQNQAFQPAFVPALVLTQICLPRLPLFVIYFQWIISSCWIFFCLHASVSRSQRSVSSSLASEVKYHFPLSISQCKWAVRSFIHHWKCGVLPLFIMWKRDNLSLEQLCIPIRRDAECKRSHKRTSHSGVNQKASNNTRLQLESMCCLQTWCEGGNTHWGYLLV